MGRIIVYEKQPERRRVPLTVNADWLPDGKIVPCYFWTPDGVCLKVLHVYECVPIAYLRERGEGIQFTYPYILRSLLTPFQSAIPFSAAVL